MQSQFTVREAKARLSEILDLVSAGVPVEITRQGSKKGRFKIIASDAEFGGRRPGVLKGRIKIEDGFDDEDPEINLDFDGQNS